MPRWPDPRFIIYLLPIGRVNPGIMEFLADSVTRALYCSCQILPPTELPMGIPHGREFKIQARDVLNFLTGRMPLDGSRIVGVMGSGIIWNADLVSLNGCGLLSDLSAVITLNVMRADLSGARDDRPYCWENIRRLILHELGHTFGNRECYAASCLMDNISLYSGTSRRFCPSCWTRIQNTLAAGPGVAKFLLGQFFYARNNFFLAAKCYSAAARQKPDIAYYKYCAAWAFAAANKKKKAGKWLLRYILTINTP